MRRTTDRRKWPAALAALLALLVPASGCAPAQGPGSGPSTGTAFPPGRTASSSQAPHPAAHFPGASPDVSAVHVVVVVEENRGFEEIVGSAQAPFLNTLARHATLLTSYRAITHPSLPNYIAMVSGDTYGIHSDCTSCHLDARNLADQLEEHRLSWKAYMQGLPAPCSAIERAGAYAKKHNPFLYFDDVRAAPDRCRKVVPFDQFATDVAGGRLPRFAFISPDLDHDMHDGPVRVADDWLRDLYAGLRDSPAWQQDTRLVITFDEGRRRSGNRVATIITGPRVPVGHDDTPYTHYSLLRSVETLFGLPHLRHAGDPDTVAIPVVAALTGTTPR